MNFRPEKAGNSPPLPNRFPANYEPLSLLGRGGMGEVWRAVQKISGQEVAVKLLRTDSLSEAAQAKAEWRFAREIRALGKLRNPGVVRLFEAGFLEDGTPWYTMEFVDGMTLSEWIESAKPKAREIGKVMIDVADAMESAHACKIFHRDLKPGNLMVTAEGTVKVLDFGIARILGDESAWPTLTNAPGNLGTVYYMAPECLAEKKRGDARSDTYALGTILFEAIAGERPFGKLDEAAHLAALGKSEPRRLREVSPQASADLEAILIKCLHHNPGSRYQSAGELAADLRSWLDGGLVEARGATRKYVIGRFWRRSRILWGAAAVAGLGLIVGGFLNFQAAKTVSAVELTQPGDDTLIFSKQPRFAWTDPESIGAYKIQITTDITDPARGEVHRAETDNPAYAPPEDFELSANQTYHWRVSSGKSGRAPWSEWNSFSIRTAPETWPGEMSPGAGTEGWPPHLSFSWKAVPQATHYELEVFRVNDRNLRYHIDNVTGTAASIDIGNQQKKPPGDRQYDWRIRGWNERGPGPWSEFTRFRTRLPSPKLMIPEPGAEKVSRTPIFRWDPWPGARMQKFMLARPVKTGSVPNTLNRYTAEVPHTTEYTIPPDMRLEPNTDYLWRIRVEGPTQVKLSEWSPFSTGAE